jgi:hypothetical protein
MSVDFRVLHYIGSLTQLHIMYDCFSIWFLGATNKGYKQRKYNDCLYLYEWNSRPICIHYPQQRHIAYDISDGDVVRQKQRKNNVCLYLYEWNSWPIYKHCSHRPHIIYFSMWRWAAVALPNVLLIIVPSTMLDHWWDHWT